MEPIVFDNEVIRQSALYEKCANTLLGVSNRDYPGKYIFDSRIECLDIDTYEKMIHGKNADKTMDAVIGICTCRYDKRKTSPRLLLVELRMDFKSSHNLSVGKMNRKVTYTRDLLGAEISIDPHNYFIFDNSVREQVKRWFARKANEGGGFKYNVAWSVDDFCVNIQSFDDLPYKPINQKEEIMQNVSIYVAMKDWNKLFAVVEFWLNRAKKYKYSNIYEFNNVKEFICEIWQKFKFQDIELNENEELDVLLIEEELNRVLS